jgi:hypothetical protein
MNGVSKLLLQLHTPLFERIRDVLEKDETEHYVLVHSSVEIRAQPVGGGPKLLIEIFQKLCFSLLHAISLLTLSL